MYANGKKIYLILNKSSTIALVQLPFFINKGFANDNRNHETRWNYCYRKTNIKELVWYTELTTMCT